MDSNYQLINSVDPSKCRAKIRDKFAKLTLSSNKKKQENADMRQQRRESAALSNVSRNLMNDLLTDDESDDEKPQQKQQSVNLIMRTDSSPSEGNIAPRKSSLQSMNTTHCTEADESTVMEPLHVSETDNTQTQQNLENVIERLSSRVSMLTVEGPVTISSEGSVHDSSQVVSTENQRMNAGRKEPEAALSQNKVDDSVYISSESEDTAIIISDSSETEEEYEMNMTPSCNSVNLKTLNTFKDDRMAKFLHDVRQNYGLTDTPERDFEDRCRQIATADTEPMSSDTLSQSIGTERRITVADTESMSPYDEFTAAEQDEAAQETVKAQLACADTEDMTKASETIMSSPHYEPVMKVGSEFLEDSMKDSRASLPDDSLTIAETSEEEESPEKPINEPQNALRESNSPSVPSKRSSSFSDQDSQFQISISAQINIKIQISQQQLQESESSNSTTSPPRNSISSRDSPEEQLHSSAQKAQTQPTALEDIPHSPPERDVPTELPKPDVKSPDDFERAERLLNELYGTTWKTPEVMHSLKKTTVRRNLPKASTKPPDPQPKSKDESSIGDFSIFRKNIPQHLDSTRLTESPSIFKTPRAIGRGSKSVRRTDPIREEEPSPYQTSHTEIIKTQRGRNVKARWRAIVDSGSESEGENASGESNKSWKMSDEEDIENKPKPVTKVKRSRTKKDMSLTQKGSDLVYLDLSKGEVEIQHNVPTSPPANHDANFNRRLEDILSSCRVNDKPKIEGTPGGKSKRKLFTANLNEDDDVAPPAFDSPREKLQNIICDDASVSLSGARLPSMFEPFNKHLEAVKTGKPIFKIQTPKSKRDTQETESPASRTPKSTPKASRVNGDICITPKDTYSFLKSLELCVSKSLCHPDALYFRDNYRLKRDELANKLYEIYNRKCFKGELDVPLKWNKKLTNTAGRCMNKKRLGERTCVIELSEKVLTSADRLRCTLIHELCHAATWIFNAEGGHGASWKAWARKANQIFPELPKIGVCHQYDIEYKYTYKCTLCAAKSHAHSKSKKVENIRCSYCHGAIEVYLNKKDKEGNTVATPVREATGFAKFVKEKYKVYKRPDLKHADIMKLLSSEFASMKVDGQT